TRVMKAKASEKSLNLKTLFRELFSSFQLIPFGLIVRVTKKYRIPPPQRYGGYTETHGGI
ncbi:MAG TPA: hypothetical protein VGD40_07995, partial [Chryseosolibacter sp.]